MVKTKSSKMVDYCIVAFCVLLILICLLPLLNVFSRSISSSEALIKNEVKLLPVGINFDAYKTIFSNDAYVWSLCWTAILTVGYTIVSMFMTVMCAYPLTYDNLRGGKTFNLLMIITMFFSAGTVPTYLLYKELNLLDNPLVLILPTCLSVFNVIIMKGFFYGIPESLRESAELDGAGPLKVLTAIYLPLSKPALATLSLFYAVGRWNGYSDALMYMKDKTYYPIQLYLYNILNNVTSVEVATQEGFTTPGLSLTLQAAAVMFATIPILMVYPWLQRYFIAGVTLGAVKE